MLKILLKHEITSFFQLSNILRIQMTTYGIMISREVWSLGQEDDSNNDTIDGNGFTENDTDQVLRLDTRHLDGTTQQWATCDEDTPKMAKNSRSYQAAPIMESPRERATPI